MPKRCPVSRPVFQSPAPPRSPPPGCDVRLHSSNCACDGSQLLHCDTSSSSLFELILLFSLTHLPFFSLCSFPQPLNVDVPEGLVLGHWRPRRSPAQLSQRPCSFLGVTRHSGDTGSVSFLPNTDPSNGQSLLWSSSAWPRLFLRTLLLSKPLPQIFLGSLHRCQLSIKI